MSKKVSIPVMSLTITGLLYILGLFVIALKPVLYVLLSTTPATQATVNGLFGFLGAFLMIWALTSFMLHPDIDDAAFKWILGAFTLFIIAAVFTSTFQLSIFLGLF